MHNGSDDKQENSVKDIKKYLQDGGEPITTAEFMEFWSSLTDTEKDEFRKAELK